MGPNWLDDSALGAPARRACHLLGSVVASVTSTAGHSMKESAHTKAGLKWAAAAAIVTASTTLANVAHADPPRGVDWIQALVDLDRMARGGAERPTATPSRHHPSRPAGSEDPNPQNLGNAWFGVAPRVTLVARDWASSTRLLGDRLSLVEQLRLSASTRMVVGRVRLSGARFTPFLQVGLGQWRVDRNHLPLTPHAIEIATQMGTGFELRVTRRLQIAAETTMTTLIREGQNDTLPQNNMLWSALVASRVEF